MYDPETSKINMSLDLVWVLYRLCRSVFPVELPDVSKVWIYVTCDDSITIVTNVHNSLWVSVLHLQHIQLFPKAAICSQLVQSMHRVRRQRRKGGNRMPFYLKLPEELESHTTFHLGKDLTTVTGTQR